MRTLTQVSDATLDRVALRSVQRPPPSWKHEDGLNRQGKFVFSQNSRVYFRHGVAVVMGDLKCVMFYHIANTNCILY